MSKSTRDMVLSLRDAKNAQTVYVVQAVNNANGKPAVKRLANVYIVRSASGTCTKVGVQAWIDGGTDVEWHYNKAVGGGYDKVAAALDGAKIGGFTIGDHGNSKGMKTLDVLAYDQGWNVLGNI